MDKINSKKKGSRFERAIAKFFQSWTGYEFSRTPQSGALRWKDTEHIASDVVCTDPKFEKKWLFSIECKFYKDIRFEHLLLGNKSCKIQEFWNQAKDDAKRAKKIPMLIMKYNGMPKEEAFLLVDSWTGKYLSTYGKKMKHPSMLIDNLQGKEAIYVYLLSDLKTIDIKDLCKSAKEHLKA